MVFRLAAAFLLALVQMIIPASSGAEIYKWVDENGNTQFGDRAPSDSNAERLDLRTINTIKSVSVTELSDRTAPASTVIMYSASWCGVCKQARKYFRQQGIPYREYDIEKTARGRDDFRKLGGTGVPVILIGRQRMNGFSIRRFAGLYNG
jgi:glutaredoxin